MKYVVSLILLTALSLWAKDFTILYTELEDPAVQDFSARYDQRIRQVWGAESDISLLSKRIVDQMKHNSPTDEIRINDETRQYLSNRGVDSVLVVVPHLLDYSITMEKRRVVQGVAVGVLDIRFSIVDLATGQSLQTMIIESDTSLVLGNTMLRSAEKSVNISIMDREKIMTDLMNSSVEQSFEMIRLFLDTVIANEQEQDDEEKNTLTTGSTDSTIDDSTEMNSTTVDDTTTVITE